MKRLRMWYNVDIYKLGAYLIPPFLRKKRMYAFICAFLAPFYWICKMFKDYRKASLQKLNVNGQVIYIEKRLCDEFELEYRDIYITDSDSLKTNIADLYPDASITMAVYSKNSEDRLYIESGETSAKSEDFIVNVPSFLSDKIEVIKTIVEYNKPAGRTYKINLYEYE